MDNDVVQGGGDHHTEDKEGETKTSFDPAKLIFPFRPQILNKAKRRDLESHPF